MTRVCSLLYKQCIQAMNTYHYELDDYWTHNKVLGDGVVDGERALIRLKLHHSQERYFHREELFPIAAAPGTRTYFHAKPYILIPNMTLTFAPYRTPTPDGSIGEVINTDVTKLKPREIGNAQAWYYPTEKALVLWECFLEAPYRQPDPRADSLQTLVWQGFEHTLLHQLPEATRIYSTFEPLYERPVFTQFLESQGYQLCSPVAFVKELGRR